MILGLIIHIKIDIAQFKLKYLMSIHSNYQKKVVAKQLRVGETRLYKDYSIKTAS
jgi:hypothetical protein